MRDFGVHPLIMKNYLTSFGSCMFVHIAMQVVRDGLKNIFQLLRPQLKSEVDISIIKGSLILKSELARNLWICSFSSSQIGKIYYRTQTGANLNGCRTTNLARDS